MKVFISLFAFLIFFAGCAEDSIKVQREKCVEQGKKFTVVKFLNHRTGEYQLKGKCK